MSEENYWGDISLDSYLKNSENEEKGNELEKVKEIYNSVEDEDDMSTWSPIKDHSPFDESEDDVPMSRKIAEYDTKKNLKKLKWNLIYSVLSLIGAAGTTVSIPALAIGMIGSLFVSFPWGIIYFILGACIIGWTIFIIVTSIQLLRGMAVGVRNVHKRVKVENICLVISLIGNIVLTILNGFTQKAIVGLIANIITFIIARFINSETDRYYKRWGYLFIL